MFGCLVEQVQEQLKQTAVGRGQKHEQELESLDLTFLIWSVGSVPLPIQQREL